MMVTIVSLVISGLALIISVLSFITNKAKHNLQQLQSQYQLFCNRLQTLLNFGTYQGLVNFKYDLENMTMFDYYDIACCKNFNDLQKQISINIDSCQNAYTELLKTMDFLK